MAGIHRQRGLRAGLASYLELQAAWLKRGPRIVSTDRTKILFVEPEPGLDFGEPRSLVSHGSNADFRGRPDKKTEGVSHLGWFRPELYGGRAGGRISVCPGGTWGEAGRFPN